MKQKRVAFKKNRVLPSGQLDNIAMEYRYF